MIRRIYWSIKRNRSIVSTSSTFYTSSIMHCKSVMATFVYIYEYHRPHSWIQACCVRLTFVKGQVLCLIGFGFDFYTHTTYFFYITFVNLQKKPFICNLIRLYNIMRRHEICEVMWFVQIQYNPPPPPPTQKMCPCAYAKTEKQEQFEQAQNDIIWHHLWRIFIKDY